MKKIFIIMLTMVTMVSCFGGGSTKVEDTTTVNEVESAGVEVVVSDSIEVEGVDSVETTDATMDVNE